MRKKLLGFVFTLFVLNGWGQTSYTSTSVTTAWNASRWNNSADGPTYASTFTANNAVNFTSGSYSFAGMGASTNVGNVSLASNVIVNFPTIGSTYATGGLVRTIDVASGGLFDLQSQSVSTAVGTGFIKSGSGVFATAGSAYTGGFTLNAGTVVARGTTAFGSGAGNILTLNGGTVAANAARSFANTRFAGGIVIGGDVQFGEVSTVVSIAGNNADLSFANDVSLGSTLRTLTLGNSAITTFSGVISNTAATGLTFAANANGGSGSFVLTGANTYTGTTTVSSGTLRLNRTGGTTILATSDVVINGGILKVSTDQTINNLTIAAGGTLLIDAGVKFTLNGTLSNAGTITDNGIFINNVANNNSATFVVSPGSAITGTGTLTGTVTLQQNIVGQRGWRVFANPFSTAQTIATVASNNAISINTTPQASGLTDARTFSSNVWNNVTGTTLAANTPYALFIRGKASEVTGSNYTGGPTAFTYGVSGTLNTTNSITPANTTDFIIVGNPYAAPVNTQALTGGTSAPYYTYQIAVTGTPQVKAGSWVASGSNSSTTATIPVLGVLAYQPASTSPYTIATTDINTTGTLQTGLFGVNDNKQLELLVEKNGDYQDKLFVRLDAAAKADGNDQNDLKKFYNDNVNVYTKSADGKNLAIDARNAITTIPVGISALTGDYNFKVPNNNLPTGSIVYLEDKFLNTQTELKAGTTYNFSITSDAASKGENRFVLNFTQKTVAADNSATGNFTAKVLGNVTHGNTVMVQVSGSTTPVSISVIDLSGKTLKTVNAVNGLNIIDVSGSTGLQLLQINNGKTTITEKVIKQ